VRVDHHLRLRSRRGALPENAVMNFEMLATRTIVSGRIACRASGMSVSPG
jgi:hypothetical protein